VFQTQAAEFTGPSIELLDFDPSLRPDEAHIIRIPQFVLPAPIRAAMENPLGVEPLGVTSETLGQIAGLFVGDLEPAISVRIQSFDRRQVLTAKGLSMILDGNTLRRLAEPGLALDITLSALIEGSDLFLRSYTRAKRVLDLTTYYREATDAELDKFSSHAKVHCDLASLKKVADSWIRRKVALLLDSPDFKVLSPRKAAGVARKFNLRLAIKKEDGEEHIVIPTEDRKALKDLLRFLDEDYLESPLSGSRFVSHSKRKLKPGVGP